MIVVLFRLQMSYQTELGVCVVVLMHVCEIVLAVLRLAQDWTENLVYM